MNKQEIKNHILKTFWDSWDKNKNISLYLGVFSPEIYEQNEDTIDEIIEELKSKEFYNDSYGGEMTGKGIVYSESQNLVEAERIQYHQSLRHKILSFLFQLYESKGYSECIHLLELTKKLEADIDEIAKEHQLLGEIGLVKNHHPSISREGIEYWNEHLLLESFKNEFSDLTNLKDITPQQRGKKLEFLMAKVLEFSGWRQEPNVETSYEQIDVVIHKNREFYLIECKWEKDPSEAEVIDKLFGKLSRRAGTGGILISMSGFTKGSVDCVKDFTNQKLILLFGKEDIEQIISNPKSFEELFNNKYKELVMRRNVV
ncbi:MAG: restriction endonuclease [Acidobacteriota bacterium]|nr:restriction endonuclease [Acidobacteriota bacterium]